MTTTVEMSSILRDEDVRKMIIGAAGRIFQKYGLNRATMEDIAQEAGKAKSTLYYYFSSKEEIFETIVTIEFINLLEAGRAAATEAGSAKEKLRRYIAASLLGMKNAANVCSIARGEIKGKHELLERLRTKFTAMEESIVKEMVTYGAQTNEFTFADAKELDSTVKITVGIIHAMELYLFVEDYDSDQVDLAAKLLANGV